MKSKNSFLIIIILIFLDISVSFSNDYFIKKVEIIGNKRIPTSFISNISNKYFNLKIPIFSCYKFFSAHETKIRIFKNIIEEVSGYKIIY